MSDYPGDERDAFKATIAHMALEAQALRAENATLRAALDLASATIRDLEGRLAAPIATVTTTALTPQDPPK